MKSQKRTASVSQMMGNVVSGQEEEAMQVETQVGVLALESNVQETLEATKRSLPDQDAGKQNKRRNGGGNMEDIVKESLKAEPTLVDLVNEERLEETVADESKCNICHEAFVEATLMECSHIFCFNCIEKWRIMEPAFQFKSEVPYKCPTCRQECKKVFAIPAFDKIIDTYHEGRPETDRAERYELLGKRALEKEGLSKQNEAHRQMYANIGTGATRSETHRDSFFDVLEASSGRSISSLADYFARTQQVQVHIDPSGLASTSSSGSRRAPSTSRIRIGRSNNASGGNVEVSQTTATDHPLRVRPDRPFLVTLGAGETHVSRRTNYGNHSARRPGIQSADSLPPPPTSTSNPSPLNIVSPPPLTLIANTSSEGSSHQSCSSRQAAGRLLPRNPRMSCGAGLAPRTYPPRPRSTTRRERPASRRGRRSLSADGSETAQVAVVPTTDVVRVPPPSEETQSVDDQTRRYGLRRTASRRSRAAEEVRRSGHDASRPHAR